MSEAELDRRIRAWMAGREPGPVPATLRTRATRVPYETGVPITSRVRDALVGRGGAWAVGGTRRTSIAVLVALGLVAAATVAAVLLAGSRQPQVPGVERWGGFTVGQPAPTVVLRALPAPIAVGDDSSVEFEDLTGSIVVILAPGTADSNAVAGALAALDEAAAATGDDVVFIVGVRASSVLHDNGPTASEMGAVDLSPAGATRDAFPDGASALVVLDRRGTVATVFAGALPAGHQLVELIRALEVSS